MQNEQRNLAYFIAHFFIRCRCEQRGLREGTALRGRGVEGERGRGAEGDGM